jgi:hypothetical protein
VDAAGVTLTCDLIDLDVAAITGTAPSNATLYDLLTTLAQESGGNLDTLASVDFATESTLDDFYSDNISWLTDIDDWATAIWEALTYGNGGTLDDILAALDNGVSTANHLTNIEGDTAILAAFDFATETTLADFYADNASDLSDIYDSLNNGDTVVDALWYGSGGTLDEVLDCLNNLTDGASAADMNDLVDALFYGNSGTLDGIYDSLNDGWGAVDYLAGIESYSYDIESNTDDTAGNTGDIVDALFYGSGGTLDDISDELVSGNLYTALDHLYDISSAVYNGSGGTLDSIADYLESIETYLDDYLVNIEAQSSYATSDGQGVVDFLRDGVTSAKGNWSALTAPGSTASYQTDVQQMLRHGLQITVASLDTNVVVRFEGSFDGTNWFNMDSADLTLTSNGTYAIHSEKLAQYVRGTFVSESGGTAATVTFKYFGLR